MTSMIALYIGIIYLIYNFTFYGLDPAFYGAQGLVGLGKLILIKKLLIS